MRRTDFRKANTYTGQKIKGAAVISFKIDGVRILYRDFAFVTRNDKVPPGLDTALTSKAKQKIMDYGDCEIFVGTFKETNRLLQQHNPTPETIGDEHIYPLVNLDKRLFIADVAEVKQAFIEQALSGALRRGYEGLVIRTDTMWYRVKPIATADVKVIGYFEQMNKMKEPKNQLGGFRTKYGNVTAFTDELRQQLWDKPEQHLGRMMEVQYKELYDTGSFRYAVKFLRWRDDKDDESFDTAKEV